MQENWIESEYSYDEQLGYISLQQSLNNDEVLGVSFQYTLNGKIFQVRRVFG